MRKRTGVDSKRSSAGILLSYLPDPQCMDGQQPIGRFTRQFCALSRLEFRLGVPCRSSIPFEFPWPQRRPSSFGHASISVALSQLFCGRLTDASMTMVQTCSFIITLGWFVGYSYFRVDWINGFRFEGPEDLRLLSLQRLFPPQRPYHYCP
ncbi:hypothetical protein EDD17DRAFT_173000 [Pisolithus thermaeus]|nr:hypothetical protein EDD17DRAFT_173000 [Pisolithus thermaeus]